MAIARCGFNLKVAGLVLAGGAALCMLGHAGPVRAAEQSRITLKDGSQIVGVVQSFEDGIYTIATANGVKSVEVGKVGSIEAESQSKPAAGGAIPQPAPAIANAASIASPVAEGALGEGALSLSASRGLGETVVRTLVETFAASGKATGPVWTQQGGAGERVFTAQAGAGQKFVADVHLSGTSGAVDDLAGGKVPLALLDRPLTAEEAAKVVAAGLGDPLAPGQEFVVAPSAVLAVVHPSNPVKSLTLAQLSDIFAGRVRNWSEVGGTNRRIQVLAPAADAGALDVLAARSVKPFEILSSARRMTSSFETADLVAADPAAIGFSELEYRGNTRALTLANDCGQVFEPNEFQIQSESYPLWSRLVLYTTNRASKLVRDFVSFAQSNAAQGKLRENGYASLMPVLAQKDLVKFDREQASKNPDLSPKFSEVVSQFVDKAVRLSVTFRFDATGTKLDGRGGADVDRLVEYVKGGGLGKKTIALVGFSENSGNFAGDVKQSKARALFVAEALRQKGLSVERLFGFGPLMPADCDKTVAGALRSRRVEVWVE